MKPIDTSESRVSRVACRDGFSGRDAGPSSYLPGPRDGEPDAENPWQELASRGYIPSIDLVPLLREHDTIDDALRSAFLMTYSTILEKAQESNRCLPAGLVEEIVTTDVQKRLVQHALMLDADPGLLEELADSAAPHVPLQYHNTRETLLMAASGTYKNAEIGANILLGPQRVSLKKHVYEAAQEAGVVLNEAPQENIVRDIKMKLYTHNDRRYAIVVMKRHFASLDSGHELVSRTTYAIDLDAEVRTGHSKEASLLHSANVYAQHVDELPEDELDRHSKLKDDFAEQLVAAGFCSACVTPIIESVYAFTPQDDAEAVKQRKEKSRALMEALAA